MSRLFTNLSGQFIDTGSPAGLDNMEPFTITAWIWPTTDGGGNAGLGNIVSKDSGTGFWRFRMSEAAGQVSTIEFQKDYATVDLIRLGTTNAITTGQWSHVACSWDGTASSTGVHLYVNGNEIVYRYGSDGTGAKQNDAAASVRIGNRGLKNSPFDGAIAHLQIHKRVLGQGEILQLMSFPQSISKAVSPGAWSLDAAGSNEPDYSGNGNVGTVTSAVFVASFPPINGIGVIPAPNLASSY